MKPTILTILFLALVFLNLNAVSHSETFTWNDVSASSRSSNFVEISMKNCSQTSVVGSPKLPVRIINLIIPKEQEVGSLNIIADTLSISGTYNVAPLQTMGYDNEMSTVFTNPDSLIYNSNALYPNCYAKVVSHGFIDGANHIVTIEINPLLYHPLSQKLVMVSSISITLNLVSSTMQPVYPLARFAVDIPKYEAYLYNSVSNPGDIDLYRNTPELCVDPHLPQYANYYNYLIICPHTTENYFDDFINWKEQKGNVVRVLTYDQIYAANLGGDDISSHVINDPAGKVRKFLEYQWLHHGLANVLMVGSIDSSTPLRKAIDMGFLQVPGEPEFNHIPSDLYFADFNGDWNGNNDPYYGEFSNPDGYTQNNDNIDYAQELFIGRLIIPPTLNAPAGSPTRHDAIRNWVEKVLAYEKNPGNGRAGYLSNFFYLAASLAANGSGARTLLSHGFSQINTHDASSSYDGELIPGTPIYEEGGNLTPYGRNIITDMSSYPGIIDLNCHGNKARMAIAAWPTNLTQPQGDELFRNYITSLDRYNIPSYQIGNESFNGLDDLSEPNESYPIFIASSCDTAQWDWNIPNNPESGFPSMAEAFTSFQHEIGGPLYIGNTREGMKGDLWENCFLQNLFASHVLEQFQNADPWNGGASFAAARLSSGYTNARHSLVYIGDPDMDIWSAVPNRLVISFIDFSTILVQDQNGANVANATVVFQSNTQKRIVQTSSEGIAITTLSYSKVTANKHNYIPDMMQVALGEIVITSPQNEILNLDTHMFVPEGSSLTLTGMINLVHRSNITVDGTLTISPNSIITGSEASVLMNDRIVIGDRIIVSGELVIGINAAFKSTPNHPWDGLFLQNTSSSINGTLFDSAALTINESAVALTECSFTNAEIKGSNSLLQFTGNNIAHSTTVLKKCRVEIHNGNYFNSPLSVSGSLDLENSDFEFNNNSSPNLNSDLTLTDCIAYVIGCDFNKSRIDSRSSGNDQMIYLDVERCYIHDYEGDAIYLNHIPSYQIFNNKFYNNHTGLNIEYSGNSGMNFIENNEIEYNYSNGVNLIQSNATIGDNNQIIANGIGVSGQNYSNWTLRGDPDNLPYQKVQLSDFYQVGFTLDSIPEYMIYNCVESEDHNIPCVKLFTYNDDPLPTNITPINLGSNFWGSTFNPATDFSPPEWFNYDHEWIPNDDQIVESDMVGELYKKAYDHEMTKEFDEARLEYKEIIHNFPKSTYVILAEKALLRIEDKLKGISKRIPDYLSLKTYYNTEDSLHIAPEIDFITNYLSNFCDIRMGNYPEAIAFYENVISNPPSLADSVFAVINLGDVYLAIDANGDKSGYIGRMAKFKPRSFEAWQQSTDHLLSLLFKTSSNSTPQIPEKECLDQNYPNPFNPETTIRFGLSKSSKVNLNIYNIKGQLVKQLVNGSMDQGYHKVKWNGDDNNGRKVASGVYFYNLETPGKSLAHKMLLLK